MPYPKPDDPDYCPGSGQEPPNYNPELQWQRCGKCGRPITAMPNGRLYPHVNNRKRARKRDSIQEGLMAHGLNRRERINYDDIEWGQAEEDLVG